MFIEMFVAFPKRKDAILESSSKAKREISIASSGSIGLHYGGKCHKTFPNETINDDERRDWCSNIGKDPSDKPWVSYEIKKSKVKLTGFAVRNGCCHYACCCIDDNEDIESCCCEIYSFSLQGSNDNLTWKTIYKAEKEKNFYFCSFRTYEFPKTEAFAYVRFVMDEPLPGCPNCMQINQIELYGDFVNRELDEENEDGDESVSIIGKVKRDEVA